MPIHTWKLPPILKFCPLPTELLHSPQELTPELTLMLLSRFGFPIGEISFRFVLQLLTPSFALISECFPTHTPGSTELPVRLTNLLARLPTLVEAAQHVCFEFSQEFVIAVAWAAEKVNPGKFTIRILKKKKKVLCNSKGNPKKASLHSLRGTNHPREECLLDVPHQKVGKLIAYNEESYWGMR